MIFVDHQFFIHKKHISLIFCAIKIYAGGIIKINRYRKHS